MTREEAKKAAEVLKAFADGKKIEKCKVGENNWSIANNDEYINFTAYKYRIVKEPQYRPFKDAEECWSEMLKHQPFGWIKKKDNGYFIGLGFIDEERDFASMFKHSTFADGEPFGIKID